MRTQVGTLLLLAASGFFQAAFALPVRHLRKWRWEQMWVAQSVTANVLFPLSWAAVVPAAFWIEAAHIPWSYWIVAYGWGLIWGLGGVAWGLTMTRLGMAFSNSFVFGITVMTGALLPLAANAVESPPHPALFGAGLVLCVLTTVLIGFLRREGTIVPLLPMPLSLRSYPVIVGIAVFAGFSTAGYGLAFTFSFGVIRSLVASGISQLSASLVVVLPVYLGAASIAIPLGVFVAARSGSLSLFLGSHVAWNWSLALVMGLCAAATAVLYGFAGSRTGHPSPNVSFGVFISFLVLGGNALGWATGELRGCTRGVRAGLLLSACGLVAGACLLNAR
ncbi:MAG: L-rhamnose/proton symporter RhaT [Bryobacteraceae bacterium]|jgi:L-rhamnose-H+ transport protein